MSNATEIPAVIQHWINEIRNPRNNDFQRDMYRMKLEALRDRLNDELAISTPTKRR